MRSAVLVTALFAASSFAQPAVEKRDVVYATAIETVLKTVWVDAEGPAPTPAPAAAPAPPPNPIHIKHTHSAVALDAVVPAASQPAPVIIPAAAPSPSPSPEPVPASPAAVPTPAPPAPAPAPPAPVSGGSFNDQAVSGHNVLRSAHQVGAVTWDDDLAASAQALASTCNFAHNVDLGPASSYGQNIASSYGTLGMHDATTELTNVISSAWYTTEEQIFGQLNLYGVANPLNSDFDAWGHFTQEVWKGTNTIGCAVQTCSDWNGYFTVCNYGPAGNYANEFADNVLPST